MHEENKTLYLKKSAVLKNGPLLCDTVSQAAVYDANVSSSRLCAHETVEIAMVVSGSGIHRVLNQAIPCKSGDVYVTAPNVPHGYFRAKEEKELLIKKICFDPRDWFSAEYAAADEPRYCYGVFSENGILAYAMLNAKTYAETDLLFDGILTESEEKKKEWESAIGAYLTQLLIKLSRYINGAIKNIPTAPSKEWGLVLSTVRIVMRSFDEPELTLESIADSLYISKSHLSRLFKKLVGESFSEYLRRIRMDQACRLLRETKLNAQEIALRCGLRDIPSFYRNFQALTRLTPNQYRQSQAAEFPSEHRTHAVRSSALIGEISDALQHGKAKVLKERIRLALEQGEDPRDILNHGLLLGMSAIGEKFKNNEVYVPEVLVAARAMNAGMQMLKPHLSGEKAAAGRVCLGTVQGDLHDIGKNLVRIMMEGKGLEVIDLGVDVAPEVFVRTAIEKHCDVIACSALLTTTIGVMGEIVRECKRAGIRDRVKIMVGGAPVTEEFCREIGADVYTADAFAAAEAAAELCRQINRQDEKNSCI